MVDSGVLEVVGQVVPAASPAWIAEQKRRARRVARYRRYADGDHDARLTESMRKLLRVGVDEDGFSLNYCGIIVASMTDRCTLQTVEADNPAASVWAQAVLEQNRIDSLHTEIHEGAIRDGDSYVLIAWDNERGRVILSHEEAFDGESGMLVLYPSKSVGGIHAAIKVWRVSGAGEKGADVLTRINVYYADRVEKYVRVNSESPTLIERADWVSASGAPLGVPVIHFRNGGRQNYGQSELRNVIAPQNALNRFAYSAVMAAELTGFRILVARGFAPPPEITPGMVISIAPEGLHEGERADLSALEAGNLSQIIDMITLMQRSIAQIARTPAPELIGDNASGEARKQAEIGLIGKVRRFTVAASTMWEDVLSTAWRIESAFGVANPPAFTRLVTRWRSPEIRNDNDIVNNAMTIRPLVGDKQTLRFVAGVFDLTEDDIERIVGERTLERSVEGV
jgi:hypothetical protein